MASPAAREIKNKERRRSREAREGGAGPMSGELRADSEQSVLDHPAGAEARGARGQANDNRKRQRAVVSGQAEHVLFLVPGLLGFESFSSFRYFGDRVVAALRSGLEARI